MRAIAPESGRRRGSVSSIRAGPEASITTRPEPCNGDCSPLARIKTSPGLFFGDPDPALSPLLLERSKIVLRTARDLFELPLLDLDDTVPSSTVASWARWFAFAGVKAVPPAPRLLFTFIDQSVQAAVRGQAWCSSALRSAASGDLLIPFPKLRLRTGYQYALIDNPTTRDAPHVRSFSDWIETEFKRGADRRT